MTGDLDPHKYRPIRSLSTAVIRLVNVTFVVFFYIIEDLS